MVAVLKTELGPKQAKRSSNSGNSVKSAILTKEILRGQ